MFLLEKPTIPPEKWWLFYLSAKDLRLFRQIGGVWRIVAYWQNDPSSAMENFRRLPLENAAVLVLAESEDLAVHTEKIPLIFGRDRHSLIERKLSALSGNNALSFFVSQGKVAGEHGERAMEQLILTAIVDSEKFLPWIQAIRQAGARIAGVTTTTLAVATLGRRVRHQAEGISLHISWNSAGLVQSVINHGFPMLSRFCAWAEDIGSAEQGWNIDRGVATIVAQTHKLLAYLQGRGLWSASLNTPIQVVLPAQVPASAVSLEAIAGISWQMINAPSILSASLQNCPPPPNRLNHGGEILLLTELSAVKNIDQVAKGTIRRRYLHWLALRYNLRAMSMVATVLLALVVYDGGQWLYQVWQIRNVQSTQSDLQSRYREKRQSFPAVGVSNQHLREAIALGEQVQECYPSLPPLILQLSDLQLKHPTIELNSVHWQNGLAETSPAQAKTMCALTLSLKGLVVVAPKDSQRDIQARFEAWINAMRALSKNVKVTVASPPLNLAQGKYVDNAPTPERANFAIDINVVEPSGRE